MWQDVEYETGSVIKGDEKLRRIERSVRRRGRKGTVRKKKEVF